MYFLVMATSLLLLFQTSTNAESGDLRRLSAEIIVINADFENLLNSELSAKHKKGLKERIKGGLAILPLLIRKSWNGSQPITSYSLKFMKEIQIALDAGEYKLVTTTLRKLLNKFPFNTSGILPPDYRPLALKRSKSIHESFCAGCHDEPDLSVSRPAWNLFKLSKRTTLDKLAARMIVGIRGDSLTGLDNPLRDYEISALIAFYSKAPISTE